MSFFPKVTTTFGSKQGKEEWIEPQVKVWVDSVKILSRIARRYPQSAYAGFVFSLQCEWDYTSRIVPGVAPHLAPIESAIHEHFLPALFEVPPDFITADFCARMTHSVCRAGIGV